MEYMPHTLYLLVHTDERDSYGRITGCVEEYELLGGCRCDDNTDVEIMLDNGTLYKPKYHIVADGHLDKGRLIGETVRVLDVFGDVRGEGTAVRVIVLNYLQYTDIWV